MVVYILIILGFNILLTQFGFVTVSANITADSLLASHNYQRSVNGIGTLSYNGTLSASATNKANEMLATNCWSHYCPPGKAPWDWIAEAGYSYTFAGENLAEGFSTTDSVMNAWMNSATHRANILSGNFNEVGFGFAYGSFQGNPNNTIVVVHFGTAAAAPAPPPSPPPIDVSQPDTPVASPPTPIVTAPEPEPDPEIKINHSYGADEPVDSSVLEFDGTVVPDNSTVVVNANEEEDGRVQADGKNFTYRSPEELPDGVYKVQAILENDNGEELTKSDVFTVNLDGRSPTVESQSRDIAIIGEDTFLINLETSEDVRSLNSNAEPIQIKEIEKGLWQATYDKSVLGEYDAIEFSAVDSVDNTSEFAVFTSIIEPKFESSLFSNQIIDTSIPEKFIDGFFGNDVRTIVASLFIIFIITLFAIDFIILARKDMLHKIKRRSHLHFAIFLIMFLAINITGFGGSILVTN